MIGLLATTAVAAVVASLSDSAVAASAVGAFGSLVAVVIAAELARRAATEATAERESHAVQLDEIHVLVNGRLAVALARIETLERELGIAPGEEITGLM